MFVRFHKNKATHGSDYSLKVDVVKSYRDKGSRSRHQVLAHIGSFKIRNWKYKERGYCEQEKLWKKVEQVFKKVRFAPDDDAKLRSELETRIPKPPPIPKPRERGARLEWCNTKVWPVEPSSPNGYKRKP